MLDVDIIDLLCKEQSCATIKQILKNEFKKMVTQIFIFLECVTRIFLNNETCGAALN